jgi:hypothetical protein
MQLQALLCLMPTALLCLDWHWDTMLTQYYPFDATGSGDRLNLPVQLTAPSSACLLRPR